MIARKLIVSVVIWIAIDFALVQSQTLRPVKLYYSIGSPASRAVMVVLQLLNVPHELKPVDLSKGENRTPKFATMNPQKTVPVLDDNGFIVLDSHAINAYLVNTYGTGNYGNMLYPRNVKARSVVDQRMYFDTGVLFPAFQKVFRGFQSKTLTGVTPELVKDFEEVYQTTEDFLRGHKFIAGDDVTIADISIFISLSSMEVILPAKPEKFSLLASYMKRCRADVPYLTRTNEPGLKIMREFFSNGFNFTKNEVTSPRDCLMQRVRRLIYQN